MSHLSVARWKELSARFDQALELAPPERAQWLEDLWREDARLADELRSLLAEHEALRQDSFLEGHANRDMQVVASASLAGTRLGAYTLHTPIGQGGAGSVWLARRHDGRFEATVAIKLLNAALIGKAGQERFRREGMLLARLTHTHIARLMDAGVSPAGIPYLVLEHVDGERIDRYCDLHKLGIRARVELFLDVMDAVGHAHANLVVHRDIKPCNVMVSHDGHVKLLDFGIAKLIGDERLGFEATRTRTGGRALTPEFAAPEQLTGGPITTVTDVYALGVLLYMLLTGAHPTGLSDASPAEFIRAITDSDAGRASAAVTLQPHHGRAAEQLADEAARRSTTAGRWAAQLVGDLDNILSKALKRASAQRYASVADFADDLRRYLHGQPVRARADSWAYRAARLVSANRAAAAAGMMAVVAMLGGLVATSWQASVAAREAQQVTAIKSLLLDMLKAGDDGVRGSARQLAMRQLLDHSAQRLEAAGAMAPEIRLEVLEALGRKYQDLGLPGEAARMAARHVAVTRESYPGDETRIAWSLARLSSMLHQAGAAKQRDAALGEAQLLLDHRHDNDSSARAMWWMVTAMRETARDNEKAAYAAGQAFEIFRRLGDDQRAIKAVRLHAAALDAAGHQERARQMLTETLAAPERSRYAPAELQWMYATLGSVEANLLDFHGAEQALRTSLDLAVRRHGDEHLEVAQLRQRLASLWGRSGRLRACVDEGRAAGAMLERSAGPNDTVSLPLVLTQLGQCLVEYGSIEEGVAQLERAAALRERSGGDDAQLAGVHAALADAYIEQGEFAKASRTLVRVAEIRQHLSPSGDFDAWHALTRANLKFAQGLPVQARQEIEPIVYAADGESSSPIRDLTVGLARAELALASGDADARQLAQGVRELTRPLGETSQSPLQMARMAVLDARLHLAGDNVAAALPLLRRAEQLMAASLHADSPRLAQTRIWLARALAVAGQDGPARELLKTAQASLAAHKKLGPQFTRALDEAQAFVESRTRPPAVATGSQLHAQR